VTGETLLGKVRKADIELVKWFRGTYRVVWGPLDKDTVGGPNDLGGSVTAGIGAKPFSADIMRHLQKNFLKTYLENLFPSYLSISEEFILKTR
jgi:hypothetical protein